jgi:nuclear protein localization family protein 4
MGQQLERDNCLETNPERPKMIFPRVAGDNEIVPPFLTQGKTVKEFEPEFLMVKLEQGEPKHNNDYNILKIH